MNRESFDKAFAGLTERRKEVLEKVLAGETNNAIAKSLIVSPATVRKHIEEICDLFGIPKGSLRERPSRRNLLIALFAKYKPELLSGAIPELLRQPESVVKKTTSRNSDSVRAKQAIAPFTTEDVEVLVQRVRSDLDKTLQKECANLYTFNLLYTPMQGSLTNLYVQTQLSESQGFGSVEFSQERQLWQEVVLRNPKLMVLGKPGAGKTTLLQYIAIRSDEVDFQSKLIPIFVSLKNLTENAKRANEIDILGYIQKKCCRSRVSEQELETLLTHGRLLFLLDGLDEVTEDKVRAVVSKIDSLVNEYGENRFIVTCRKEYDSYKSRQFCNFAFCKVADFEQAQIEEFIKNWFDKATENRLKTDFSQATQLIDKLKLPDNNRIREIADTPLLLHLICLIFQDKGDLPARRVDLYKEGIDLLLAKWNRFNDRTQIDALDINLVELRKVLRQIAASTFEQGKSSFEKREIQHFIKNYSRTLSDIEVLSGLLVQKSWQIYTFSHQTFQEYLTAEALSTSQLGWRKVLTHIAEPRWREVFFIMLEMLPNTDEFIGLMKQKIHELRNQDDDWKCFDAKIDESDKEPPLMSDADLQAFLIQASQKSSTVKNIYKPAAIRAFYFSCSIIVTNFLHIRTPWEGSIWAAAIDNQFELACDIDDNFRDAIHLGHNLETDIQVDYRLILAFLIVSELALHLYERYAAPWADPFCGDEYPSIYSIYYELTCNLDRKLKFTIPISAEYDYKIGSEQLCLFEENQNQPTKTTKKLFLYLPYKLTTLLQQIKSENSSPMNEELEKIVEWWGSDGFSWYQELRNLIIEQRNIGNKQWLDYYNHYEVLAQYYKASKVLVDCLNSGCKVPDELRSIIENNLFLPLDS